MMLLSNNFLLNILKLIKKNGLKILKQYIKDYYPIDLELESSLVCKVYVLKSSLSKSVKM